ncbi:GNAT family N-acetyltransferase [Demequina sp.]|uniref:GNAT family N-acetyltransferase n=1 Tax=Demequina sp. TaxID=2050685 RepID=UPI0025E1B441|nr:GNAT family N-acetyltransferase [Demequina sp.]
MTESVTRNDAEGRYELRVDGELAGIAEFTIEDDLATFTHTELDESYRGRGLAALLAGDALADAVAQNLRIVPLCPYIARYLRSHDVPGAVVERPQRA